MRPPTIFSNRQEQARALANCVAGFIGAAKAASRRVVIALAGGETPRLSYQLLGEKLEEESAWGAVDFIPTDERDVADNHPRRNDKMLRETLGENARILPLESFLKSEDTPKIVFKGHGAFQGAQTFKLSDVPRIDFAILGMGEDGHVASIFPDGINPPEARLTLPLETFVAVDKAALLITGKNKNDALHRFLAAAESNIPVRVLFDLRRENGKSEIDIFYAP